MVSSTCLLLCTVDDKTGSTWQDVVVTIATVTAALGAVAAALIAALAYRRQSLDRHRDQASKVGAWIEREYIAAWGDPKARLKGQRVRVRNASDQPIFNVVALIRDAESRRGVRTAGFTTLPPGADEADDITPLGSAPMFVTLSFTDSAGSRWRRDTNPGRLIEEHPPRVPPGELTDRP